MPLGAARLKTSRLAAARALTSCGLALALVLFASLASQHATAAAKTRNLARHRTHTGKRIAWSGAARAASTDALRAALERLARRSREAARLAAAAPPPPPPPPRDGTRLYDGADAAESTGAIVAAGAQQDRVPDEQTLFYAAQPERQGPSFLPDAPVVQTLAVAAPPARLPQPPAATTIAFKRTANQADSTIVAAPPRIGVRIDAAPGTAPTPRGHPDNDPWLEAVMLSPSIGRYLTTLVLGDQDYRALAPLVEKPESTVLMTFSAHPNSGLATDRFSGSAVVFLPTVTYPMHTASLR